MCGICGFLTDHPHLSEDSLRSTALAMANTLEHRGPDAFGVWADAEAGAALGHRRLSIQDLSAAGGQPMVSENGRFVISYNGEIYNFLELRGDLEGRGHTFRGHSDTEILLAAIGEWGTAEALRRCNGMFAFGLWDVERRTLTLARDRVGKKPLYYGWCKDTLLFGSELKALRAHPDFDPEIDRDALGLFVQYSWIPGPYSIFKRIRKLPAGTLVTIKADSTAETTRPEYYWRDRDFAEQGRQDPFPGSLDEAADELEALLRDAVGKRMIADVGLGGMLSSGVDSTTVVALMQAQSSRPVKTFTIGYHDPRYNEADAAKAIARHLGTEHTELHVSPEDGLEVIPQLPSLYDEPFADSSQIPMFIVSRLARSQVTVALSGDGGDEIFGGYQRYRRCVEEWEKWGRLPLAMRRAMVRSTTAAAREGWRLFGTGTAADSGELAKWRRLTAKLEQRTDGMDAESPLHLFAHMRSRCDRSDAFVIGARQAPDLLNDPSRWIKVADPRAAMMYLDFAGYLADDNLVKVDRASMGVSLEIRSPLLDYRVAEFAWTLPVSMLIGPDGGKLVLRKVLDRYVPRELTDRPKWGFGVPIATWMRGPLRDWVESLLDETLMRQQGFLKPDAVTTAWRQHLSGWRDHRELLWSILMFQAWRQAWADPVPRQQPLRATA